MDDAIATAAPPANLFRRLRIKSRQVMLLDALDEHRNLRRAAAAIHTTQPAATALLQQLEEGLGVVLFERHARGMEPTVYGDVMIGRLPDQFYDEDLEIEQLEGESMSVVARPGHPLFDLTEVTLADLVAQTWILHPLGSPMRRRVEQALQHASVAAPPDIVETSST